VQNPDAVSRERGTEVGREGQVGKDVVREEGR